MPASFSIKFYPCYGMAEATLIVSGGLKKDPPVIRYVNSTGLKQNQVISATGDQESAEAIVGVGRSWLDQKIVIADPESLTLCPDELVGEIWVCGSSVAGGYWRRPQLNICPSLLIVSANPVFIFKLLSLTDFITWIASNKSEVIFFTSCFSLCLFD